jgi:hypothetical protein
LKQLSRDVVTMLRHRANKVEVHVDGAGMADIMEVAAYYHIEPELIIEIARMAEKPRLQIWTAVLKNSVLPLDHPGGGLDEWGFRPRNGPQSVLEHHETGAEARRRRKGLREGRKSQNQHA